MGHGNKRKMDCTIVKNINKWINRKHGEINCYLTQFLTDHEIFGKYLHRMKKLTNEECIYCNYPIDDANHTFFQSNKWKEEREDVERTVGIITPDTIMNKMVEHQKNWDIIATYS